jgi:predicted ATPase
MPDGDAQALIRWEYDKLAPADGYARHHVQIRSTVSLGGGRTLDLNKLHVPTGWTTIEEVIRFLIHDLEVKPPCGDEWHDLLAESERAFYENFTSKRYRADPAEAVVCRVV